jgi:hypothetical protein
MGTECVRPKKAFFCSCSGKSEEMVAFACFVYVLCSSVDRALVLCTSGLVSQPHRDDPRALFSY